MPRKQTPEAQVMAGADKVAQDIMNRDRADVEIIRKKAGTMSYAGHTWNIDPKEGGKLISDNEIMSAASAARRLHERGDLWGGLGEKGYNNLQAENQKRTGGKK